MAHNAGVIIPTLLLAILTCNSCHEDHVAYGDHPVGIAYDVTRADLRKPAPRELLIDGRVECTSCHVTHEEESVVRFRLRAENATTLCVSCHVLR